MKFGKSFTLGAVLVAALLLPGMADAQLSIAGGRSLPMGDFSDEAVAGWMGQASLGFGLPALPVGLRADVMFQDFRNVDREPGLYARVGGEWFRQLGFMLNATHAIPIGNVSPYALIGIGVLREWHEDYSYNGTRQWNLNGNLGAGLAVPAAGGALFVEARGIMGTKALPLTRPAVSPEVKFTSVPLLIGYRF